MTLKAFKSVISVGMQLSITDHWLENLRHTVRTVTKVQGNGIFFRNEGETARSWMAFPKAGELQFDGTTARICVGEKHWTLDVTPNGIVDHYRWERARERENEIDGERRMAEEARERGADMTKWRHQWLERSDAWRHEIGHEREDPLEEIDVAPTLQS